MESTLFRIYINVYIKYYINAYVSIILYITTINIFIEMYFMYSYLFYQMLQ
jgi:hypothetical protein